MTWTQINRRYASEGVFQENEIALFNPAASSSRAYRYSGARIPNPWIIEASADPSGLRTLRAGQEEQLTIERVQQALA